MIIQQGWYIDSKYGLLVLDKIVEGFIDNVSFVIAIVNLGIEVTKQFLGIFVGGTLGGWLYGAFGLTSIYLFCTIVTLFWLAIAFNMKNPQYSTQA